MEALAKPKEAAKPAPLYPYNPAFFSEAVQDAQLDVLSFPKYLSEKQDVRLKPNFDTACWVFQPPHSIFIGTEIFNKKMVKPGLTAVQQKKYIKNHYVHEMGHGMYTERDMGRIQGALRRIGAPFPLYNLFEDAYMEEAVRADTGYQFGWDEFEEVKFGDRPESILFAFIQVDGKLSVALRYFDFWKLSQPPEKSEEADRLIPKVWGYYKRMVAVSGSMELMPLIAEWLKEFGKPPEEKPKGGSGGNNPNPGSGDDSDADAEPASSGKCNLALSAELQDGEKFKQFCLGTSRPGEDIDFELPRDYQAKLEAATPENVSLEAKEGTVLRPYPGSLETARAEALAEMLLKMFELKARRINTFDPQKRLSVRNMATDGAPYRRVELPRTKKQNLLMVVECSSSMGGHPMAEARVLVHALSLLAARGIINAKLILTAGADGSSRGRRPRGCTWERHSLPMKESDIARIQAYSGAEGLEGGMTANMAELKRADYVFAVTDANITDAVIKKAAFHAQGVETWGLYAGAADVAETMLKYFDKAIVRANAEELATAIIQMRK